MVGDGDKHASQQFTTKDSGQREQHATGAQRDARTGKGRYDLLPPEAIRRWAELMERGATKYGDRNWEKGMPLSRMVDSAFRHLFQLAKGDSDEDHAAAVLFNIGAVIAYKERIAKGELPEELDDLPKQKNAFRISDCQVCGEFRGHGHEEVCKGEKS